MFELKYHPRDYQWRFGNLEEQHPAREAEKERLKSATNKELYDLWVLHCSDPYFVEYHHITEVIMERFRDV